MSPHSGLGLLAFLIALTKHPTEATQGLFGLPVGGYSPSRWQDVAGGSWSHCI